MVKQGIWSTRAVRLGISLSIATLLLGQMPLRSLLDTPALGQAAPGYGGPPSNGDGSGSFFNQSLTEAALVALLAAGVVSAPPHGAGEANAAAAAAQSSVGATPASVTNLPDPTTSGDEKKSLFDILRADRAQRFNQFTNAAEINEIKDNPLSDQQNSPYTLFAPTDAAINALPAQESAKLTDKVSLSENKAENTRLLLKHVVLGKYSVRDLEKLDNGFPLATASGDTLTVTRNPDGTVNANGVPVGREDIKANNGLAHPVNAVIK